MRVARLGKIFAQLQPSKKVALRGCAEFLLSCSRAKKLLCRAEQNLCSAQAEKKSLGAAALSFCSAAAVLKSCFAELSKAFAQRQPSKKVALRGCAIFLLSGS